MIRLLYPTVRPEQLKATYGQWISSAAEPEQITLKIAVNTYEERQKLSEFNDVMVVGSKRRGAPYSVFRLYQALSAEESDIVVLVCDDIHAPPSWDAWLISQFSGQSDAIIVNDGGQFGPCVTQPIMTFGCVLKLNRVVNHPSYNHFFADAELHANLSEMGVLRDLRTSGGPMFEHRNWAWGKRDKDQHDEYNISRWTEDEHNMHSRMGLPLARRLEIDKQFFDL